MIKPNESGLGSTPIGPTWGPKYFLGADTQGRDVAARILYGGRASLIVGISAALLAVLPRHALRAGGRLLRAA